MRTKEETSLFELKRDVRRMQPIHTGFNAVSKLPRPIPESAYPKVAKSAHAANSLSNFKKHVPTLRVYHASDLNINFDEDLDSSIDIVRKLKKAGHDAYIVGGAIRDLCFGIEPTDVDISTSATPEQVQAVFKRRARIIGRRFIICLIHNFNGEDPYEVSTFRRDNEEETRFSLEYANVDLGDLIQYTGAITSTSQLKALLQQRNHTPESLAALGNIPQDGQVTTNFAAVANASYHCQDEFEVPQYAVSVPSEVAAPAVQPAPARTASQEVLDFLQTGSECELDIPVAVTSAQGTCAVNTASAADSTISATSTQEAQAAPATALATPATTAEPTAVTTASQPAATNETAPSFDAPVTTESEPQVSDRFMANVLEIAAQFTPAPASDELEVPQLEQPQQVVVASAPTEVATQVTVPAPAPAPEQVAQPTRDELTSVDPTPATPTEEVVPEFIPELDAGLIASLAEEAETVTLSKSARRRQRQREAKLRRAQEAQEQAGADPTAQQAEQVTALAVTESAATTNDNATPAVAPTQDVVAVQAVATAPQVAQQPAATSSTAQASASTPAPSPLSPFAVRKVYIGTPAPAAETEATPVVNPTPAEAVTTPTQVADVEVISTTSTEAEASSVPVVAQEVTEQVEVAESPAPSASTEPSKVHPEVQVEVQVEVHVDVHTEPQTQLPQADQVVAETVSESTEAQATNVDSFKTANSDLSQASAAPISTESAEPVAQGNTPGYVVYNPSPVELRVLKSDEVITPKEDIYFNKDAQQGDDSVNPEQDAELINHLDRLYQNQQFEAQPGLVDAQLNEKFIKALEGALAHTNDDQEHAKYTTAQDAKFAGYEESPMEQVRRSKADLDKVPRSVRHLVKDMELTDDEKAQLEEMHAESERLDNSIRERLSNIVNLMTLAEKLVPQTGANGTVTPPPTLSPEEAQEIGEYLRSYKVKDIAQDFMPPKPATAGKPKSKKARERIAKAQRRHAAMFGSMNARDLFATQELDLGSMAERRKALAAVLDSMQQDSTDPMTLRKAIIDAFPEMAEAMDKELTDFYARFEKENPGFVIDDKYRFDKKKQ